MNRLITSGDRPRRTFAVVRVALTLACALGLAACGRPDTNLSGAATVPTTDFGTGLADLQLVTETDGWVLTDKALLWTVDGGKQWKQMKLPKDLPVSAVLGAFFIDPAQGWMTFANVAADSTQQATFSSLHTTDGGKTWAESRIAAITPELMGASPAYMDFVDPQHGWVALHLQSSSNFNAGVLYQTTDGGRTWVERKIPIGSPINFINTADGWTAGGALGNELYVTHNGGQTWAAQAVPPPQTDAPADATYDLPTFLTSQDGILPVTFTSESGASTSFYATHDGGRSWKQWTSTPLPAVIEQGVKPVAKVFNADTYLVLLPNGKAKKTKDGGKHWEATTTPDGVVKLTFATATVGWALRSAGSCVKPKEQCSRQSEVLGTVDGGQTWTPLLSLKVKYGK
ncbi:MAG: hypothetical protein ACJ8CR_19135 [Roseiflexaceae bacterium]